MEAFLTSTPFGLSVLGGLIAGLFAVAGLGLGWGLGPARLRPMALLTLGGQLLPRLSMFAALMVVVTYGAILVYYFGIGLLPWHPVKEYLVVAAAGAFWVSGVLLLFRALLMVDDS